METDQNLNISHQKEPSVQGRRLSGSSGSRSEPPCQPKSSWLKSIGIEPVMLFHGIANSGMTVIVQNFYIDRICRVSDSFTNEICLNLTQNARDEKLVESGASEYTMYQSLIEYGFPVILALFIGPWTDKYGNKPIILLSLLGYLLSCFLYMFLFYNPLWSPEYILMASIPIAASGGSVTFVISTFGFMMKQTDVESRSIRLSAMSIMWDFGGLLGCLAGAKIFDMGGFLSVFIFATVFYGIAFLYSLILLSEELPEQNEINGYLSNCLRGLFDISALKETFQSCFKRRQGKRRMWIIILMTCLSLQLLCWSSKYFQYLFTRNKFGWDTEAYSVYSAVNTFLGNIGGALTALLLIKIMGLKDIIILILNCMSNLSAYFIFAFAISGWQMYLGSVVQMFGSITTAVIRSMLSKCVSKDEQGRLLSFVTCVELSMQFVAGPLYGLIYMKTELIFPGSIFLVAAGLTAVMLGLFIYLSFSMKRRVTYAVLVED